MKELLEEIRDDVKKTREDVTTLLVKDGRKDERIKSLELTRKWMFGIFGTVITAFLISAII